MKRNHDLDKVAHEAYQAHRIACENWDNGYINDIWLDDNKNICIRYDNGKWWHYSTNDGDNGHGGRHNFWIYDKLTHNTTRWFTADGKVRGHISTISAWGLQKTFLPAPRKFCRN